MTWTVLFVLLFALALAVLGIVHRRVQAMASMSILDEQAAARSGGSHDAQLQYPVVDLGRCLGCGSCVRACPESGVLGLAHGQAVVVHGSRCVGHGLCVEACPMDAIAVTLGDLTQRHDIPVLTDELQAEGVPGLFLAGEVTGYALVRTAIHHGTRVADQVAAGCVEPVVAVLSSEEDLLDLCIVGAGPAGLACALRAKELGLACLTIERDSLGGTVAKYPRRKLVMTQPVELPLYGRLKKTSYLKEELVGIWEGIAEKCELEIRTGEELVSLQRDAAGVFTVQTRTGTIRARNVCLGLGRRGTPRKLGVPGEALPKVVYSLIDAASYQGRNVLVVGGGDSAVEAAIALAEQPGNRVVLSYRKASLFRIKVGNRDRLEARVAEGVIQTVFESQVEEIQPLVVGLAVRDETQAGGTRRVELPNDDVFVFAGGIPPFDLLRECEVSFDASRRKPEVVVCEQGTGILRALCWGLGLTVATMLWVWAFAEYYELPWDLRPASGYHSMLEPTGPVGLTLGGLATGLILLNLVYLLRRSRFGRWLTGSVQNWLSIHVVTGILSLLFLAVHGGMIFRNTAGGLAFGAVVILVVSGAIGRYFYGFLPKAANGRNLERDEARQALELTLAEWDAEGRGLDERVREELQELQQPSVWGANLGWRIAGLIGSRLHLRIGLARLSRVAVETGTAPRRVRELMGLARDLHNRSLVANHFEDLRAIVGSWRFLHRWLALGMVLLAANHIAVALRYARLW